MIRKAVFEMKLSKRRNYEETPDDEEEQMIENEEGAENEVQNLYFKLKMKKQRRLK